jgi:hypothetical protein
MNALKALRRALEAALEIEGSQPSAVASGDWEDRAAEASIRIRSTNYFTPDGRWTGCRGKRPS